MYDELRQKRYNGLRSWLDDVAYFVGFSRFHRDKNPIIDEYYKALEMLKTSHSDHTDLEARDTILACFMKILNVQNDLSFLPNKDNGVLLDNLGIVFRNVGLNNGIDDIFLALKDENKRLEVSEIIKSAKAARIDSQPKEAMPSTKTQNMMNEKSSGNEEIQNFIMLRLDELAENKCSSILKRKLSKKYYYVYDLLNTTFEELKLLLSDNEELPTMYLTELEILFRTNGMYFLDKLPLSTDSSDALVRIVIRDSVTAVLNQFGECFKKQNVGN